MIVARSRKGSSLLKFRFTIIIAAYNTGAYLDETVASLISQDIGFKEHVQVILSDDGSTDNTGCLCDRWADQYPRNIKVLHLLHAGASAARNAALPHIEGEIVNFLDSDDKLSSDTLSLVDRFFKEHPGEVDMASIPMHFFEGATGEHILNYKYAKGTRVIDLTKEPDCIQLSLSSSFVLWEWAGREFSFDTRLKFAEDAREAVRVLARKKKLGVIAGAKYFYRKRTGGSSALQRSEKKKEWYFPQLEHFCVYSLERYKDNDGCIPRFVQFSVMYILQWMYRQSMKNIQGVLGERAEEFVQAAFALLEQIDDDIILSQRQIFASHKAMLLRKKHGGKVELVPVENDVAINCAGYEVARFSICAAKWEFLRREGETFILEGYVGFMGLLPEDLKEMRTFLSVNGEWLECEQDLSAPDRVDNAESMGEIIFPSITFRARIDIEGQKQLEISLYTFYRGSHIHRKIIKHGLFFPVTDAFPHSYARFGNYLAETKNGVLKLRKVSLLAFICREVALWKDFVCSHRAHAGKAMLYRGIYQLLRPLLPKDIWLISDRINKADDNGEALFRYLGEGKKHPHSYFVLRADSRDYSRVKGHGKVLDYLSVKHKLLHLAADKIISSSADDYVMNPFGYDRAFYWDILKQKQQIFLQHGITKDDISGWIGRSHKNMRMIVTASPRERQSMLEIRHYLYDGEQVKLTGFPRYDNLRDEKEKIIAIMPTWRKWLDAYAGGTSIYNRDGLKHYNPSLKESEYFRYYDALLNHTKLLQAAEEYGYEILFMPHPNMQSVVDWFHRSRGVMFASFETSYKEVISKSSMAVTDYSSVVFDFAYLGKPVLYTHFDSDRLYKEHLGSKSYFDYERDGFGEVERNIEDTVARMIEYMKNGCQMKEKYRQRVDSFFAFHDGKNCMRVYKEICAL